MWWYCAAFVYALIFWNLCLRWRGVVLALIFALAPFQEDISATGSIKFSLTEANVFLALPFVVLFGKRMVKAPTLGPAILYVGICVISSLINWRQTALLTIVQTALFLIVLVAVFSALPKTESDLLPSLNGLVIVGAGLAILAVATRSFQILGLNKNGLGASLGTALLVGIELWLAQRQPRLRRWYTIGVGVIGLGLVGTLSRGAWLGAIVGMCWIFIVRRRFRLLLKVGVVLVPLVTMMWLLLPEEKRETATDLRGTTYNVSARIASFELALAEFKKSPWLGVGVGLRKEYDATNLVMSTLAETGICGMTAFLLLHVVLFWSLWRAQRWLPRSSVAFSIVVIAGALVAEKFTHGLVDHYWSRGSLTDAWASVGMAFFAIGAAKRRLIAARVARLEAQRMMVPRIPETGAVS